VTLFYDLTRRLLEERLSLVRQGTTPNFTDIRHFFYECRNKFLRDNPHLKEIDSKSKSLYGDFQSNVVDGFCIDHCGEFGISRELYWRLREQLNIWAEAKAVCEGDAEKFMIDRDTRPKVGQNCSFILLCEKKTVSRELLEELRNRGYKVHLVSTGGQSPSDVHESLIEAVKDVKPEEPNFYVLVLHDFDTDGLTIYYNLKDRIDGVIDLGVNRNFFKQLPKIEWRLVEEQRLNKKDNQKLKKRILLDTDNLYSLEDYDYLQGKLSIVLDKKGKQKKVWEGKRVEIDAIHVAYGIKPFVDYIEQRIKKECKLWDLIRVGVEEFELAEPKNPFEGKLKDFNYGMSMKRYNVYRRIAEPIEKVRVEVENITAEFLSDFWKLTAEKGMRQETDVSGGKFVYQKEIDGVIHQISAMTLDRHDFNVLKGKYKDGFERKYVPDFEDSLKELNKKVHNYKGDGNVEKAKEDLGQQFADLQIEVNVKAEEDEEAQEFEEDLDQIDWGEEEFDELEVPDEKVVLRALRDRIEERLKELEAEE